MVPVLERFAPHFRADPRKSGGSLMRVFRDTRFARDNKKIAAQWALAGDSLTLPPRGYAADHPAIEDLKRKDFIVLASLSRDAAIGPDLVELAGARFTAAVPLMRFLGEAVGVPY
jgi:uncharacterized protein (DUF2461 family)